MSFPKYPSYKDSGVEWIGSIPTHWRTVPLKWLVDEQRPIMYGIVLPGPDVGEGVPILKGGNVKAHRMRLSEMARTTSEIELPYARARLRGGDLVYAIRGTIGDCEIVPTELVGSNITQDVARVAPHLGVDAEWLRFALLSAPVRESLASGSLGAAIRGVNIFDLKRAYIPTPDASEQLTIARFLRCETAKIEALIAEQQRLMELLQEKRQAVISHAVTKGLNPAAPMKPSGVEWLGEVPAHWEVMRLGNVFREVVEPGTDDLPILSVSIHHGVSDDELPEGELDRKVTRSEDRSKYKRVEPGDLVYNMMRAWQGGFGTVAVSGMVSPAYVVARPRSHGVTAFVELVLRTPQAIEQMRRHSKGVTDFRLRLYWDEFKNIRVALPSPDEARAICEMVSAMDEQFSEMRAACEASIALLSERRTGLISAAVTGQVDVRSLVNSEAV